MIVSPAVSYYLKMVLKAFLKSAQDSTNKVPVEMAAAWKVVA